MKIVAKSDSKTLRKEDVEQPFVAIMSDVRVHTFPARGTKPAETKDLLQFTDPTIKPLGLNVTNKRILIAAYGDESDHWRGKPIEVYVDPNVTNSNGEIVGGIRLRIPTAPAPAPRPTPSGAPNGAKAGAPKPNQPTRPLNIEEKHRLTIAGYRDAMTPERVHEWAEWAGNFEFPPPMAREQSDARRVALERLAKGRKAGSGVNS